MKREYKLFLKDIAESCRFIQAFVEGIDYEQFMKDEKTLSAVIRKLEVIGEAAKKIPDSLKKKYPHIQWKKNDRNEGSPDSWLFRNKHQTNLGNGQNRYSATYYRNLSDT